MSPSAKTWRGRPRLTSLAVAMGRGAGDHLVARFSPVGMLVAAP